MPDSSANRRAAGLVGAYQRVVPYPIRERLAMARRDARQWRRHLPWRADPRAVLSRRRLRALRDRYRGQRCFILGNGPSLNQTDLTRLRDEYTFGSNRVYLLFPELGFTTTFIASVNAHVVEQFGDEITAQPVPHFIEWESRRSVRFNPRTIFVRSIGPPAFFTDPVDGLWQGATVTYINMQLAYYLGFETVYLIGVDHNFATSGPAHQLVVSEADDPNHFHPDYFGKGSRWQLPDLETSEMAYAMARRAYEQDGRQILDATVGGKLAIFPKVDYDSLF